MPDSIGSLTGGLGDAQRHALARVALTTHLVSHPQVIECLLRWEQRYGAIAADKEFRDADAALRAAAQELIGSDSSPVNRAAWEALPPELRDRLLSLVARCDQATKKLRASWRRGGKALGAALVILVRDELKLTPQVADDLLKYFGATMLKVVPSVRVYVAAPPLRVHFETLPGESCKDAEQRLIGAAIEALAALRTHAEQARGKTRPPSTKAAVAKIERNAEWFYRSVIRHEQISDLAVEFDQHRQTVQHGIRETRRLLEELPMMNWRRRATQK